jgi:hypothetical protein
MNPDLAMATELKATGTGNLFMVFGERTSLSTPATRTRST